MWQSAVNWLTRDPSYVYNLLKRNATPASRDLAVSALALPLAPVAAAAELARAWHGGAAPSPCWPGGRDAHQSLQKAATGRQLP